MTFLKYSRLTSSSFVDCVDGDDTGEPTRDDGSDAAEDKEVRVSAGLSVVREVQYPTPGFRCRSRSAADDWTFRSSSRRVFEKTLEKKKIRIAMIQPY